MALAVPLSRFTSRVGGGSAFFVRRTKRFWKHEQATNDYTCFDSSIISVSLDWLIMDFERIESHFRQWVDNLDCNMRLTSLTRVPPNKSPEPTAVAAAVAIHAASRRWLSFLRWAVC